MLLWGSYFVTPAVVLASQCAREFCRRRSMTMMKRQVWSRLSTCKTSNDCLKTKHGPRDDFV
eukprot:2579693-Amphidinium_carterae.1